MKEINKIVFRRGFLISNYYYNPLPVNTSEKKQKVTKYLDKWKDINEMGADIISLRDNNVLLLPQLLDTQYEDTIEYKMKPALEGDSYHEFMYKFLGIDGFEKFPDEFYSDLSELIEVLTDDENQFGYIGKFSMIYNDGQEEWYTISIEEGEVHHWEEDDFDEHGVDELVFTPNSLKPAYANNWLELDTQQKKEAALKFQEKHELINNMLDGKLLNVDGDRAMFFSDLVDPNISEEATFSKTEAEEGIPHHEFFFRFLSSSIIEYQDWSPVQLHFKPFSIEFHNDLYELIELLIKDKLSVDFEVRFESEDPHQYTAKIERSDVQYYHR